jgi:tRNA-splicing ligase RtcB
MKPLREIGEGEEVVAHPFEGVAYEEPTDRLILGNELFDENSSKELRKRGLLPLKMNDQRIGILARLVGYILGDGWFNRWKEIRRGKKKPRERLSVVVCGEEDGLQDFIKDIKSLGFKPSKIYPRSRRMIIKTHYGVFTTTGHEKIVRITARSFALLINKLGVPIGKKVEVAFSVPNWILEAPLWVKRNFLAGFFGAELTEPLSFKEHPFNFQHPMLTISKLKDRKQSGQEFLKQIKRLLKEFDIDSTLIYEIPISQKTVGLRLVISGKEDNLINLWSKIGYEYNHERQYLACLAAEYLKLKKKHKSELKDRTKPILFPTFEEYVKQTTQKLGKSGMVFDTIIKKEELKGYNNFVYDFTVNHKDHNFIANGFVVSNCGVRLLRTNLTEKDVRPKLPQILESLFHNIPSGLGSKGKIRLTPTELDKILANGVDWAIQNGYGWPEDAEHCEEKGHMPQADPAKVSTNAKSRGLPQTGSLGSGNHFLEIDIVDKIFDPKIAKQIGIFTPGQIMILIHTGSRGLGHQVCSDYLRVMEHATHKYKIQIPDRELACAPGTSPEAQDYYAAMAAACNYAWANRQMITHWTRQTFQDIYRTDPENLDLHLIYDVAHNIAKIETHKINGKPTKVYCHRKGATRAFCAGHPDIPKDHRNIGQIVLLPGSMMSASYVMVGTPRAMEISFGSTAHGAGRFMSRAAATKRFWGANVKKEMEQRGILVRCASLQVLSEEAGPAYKSIDAVAEVSHQVGIATKVARLVPIGVTKG